MLSSFEDDIPIRSPPIIPKIKPTLTQNYLEKFKTMTLIDIKGDVNRSSMETQESFEKKSINSKNSSSSKKRIQKKKNRIHVFENR